MSLPVDKQPKSYQAATNDEVIGLGLASYNPPRAIVNQPAFSGGMLHMVPFDTPPGLEHLTALDQLLIHQKVELIEVVGFETNNKYSIKNNLGQQVYYAIEDNDCLTRNCCGPIRPFDMKIFDNSRNEIIHLYRPLACQGCCFPCCLQSMKVSSPPGHLIGTIEQEWRFWGSSFAIKNKNGDTLLRVEGPCCPISCCDDVDFFVTSGDGKIKEGKISKQWTGLAKELFTDADNFGIAFPMDLDVKMKAVMLGACFLIDFMFFERQPN